MLRAAFFRQSYRIARTRAIFRHLATQPTQLANPSSVGTQSRIVMKLPSETETFGMSAAEGFGWAQFEFGDRIGDGQRYTILRKLGWGMHSSTWLARDKIDKRFVAIKALTSHMTKMNDWDHNVYWEAEALRLMSFHPPSPHCIQLLDEFTIPGRGSAGPHLCFVSPVYSGDVKTLVKSRTTPLDLPTAKRIILHFLRGIAHAHSREVVHTDLKPDNIFFTTELDTADMNRWIQEDPSRYPMETSNDGVVRAAVSQPLPLISEELARRATYLLADFGCALPSKLHDDREITAVALRAPEVFLGGKWDTPADIWSFGCLVFELAVSRHLFKYSVNEKHNLTEVENMLYQMILFTSEESFRAAQLNVCPRAAEYFNPSCQLKKEPPIFRWPLEDIIDIYKTIPPVDIPPMAALMYRCLRLNPDERATAEDLLQDPWLEDADG